MRRNNRTVPVAGEMEESLERELEDIFVDESPELPLPKRYKMQAEDRFLHKKLVTCMVIYQPPHNSPPLLITGSEDCTAKVWDLFTLKPNLSFEVHTGKIISIALHAESGKIVTGGEDAKIIIWDPTTGKVHHILNETKSIHQRTISALAIVDPKPQSTVLIVASHDRILSLWDMHRGEMHYSFPSGHTDLLLSVTAVHDYGQGYQGITVITGSWDKTIRIFKWQDKEGTVLLGHVKSVTTIIAYNAMVQSKTCPLLISGSLDKTCIVWDLTSQQKIRTLTGHRERINCVRVFDRSHIDEGLPPLVITSSDDKETIIWDLLSGEALRRMHHSSRVVTHDLLLSHPAGLFLATSDGHGKISTWNCFRTNRTRRFPTAAVTAIDLYAPRPGEPLVKPIMAIGSIDGKISLFEVGKNDDRKLERELIGHTSRINALVIYSPRNLDEVPLLISCDGIASIKVWNLFEFSVQRELVGHSTAVFTIALYDPHLNLGNSILANHPSSREDTKVDVFSRPLIVTGGFDKDIRIWDFTATDMSKLCVGVIPNAHDNFVRSIAVMNAASSDEDPLFVSGSYDLTSKLWNLRTLECLRVFTGVHTGYVFTIQIYDPVRHLGLPLPSNRALTNTSGQTSEHAENDEFLERQYLQRVKHSVLCDRLLITASYDNTLAVWNMRTGAMIYQLVGHAESVTALTLHLPESARAADGSRVPVAQIEDPLIISGSIDRKIIIWNLFTGERVQQLIGHVDRVCYLKVFSLDAQTPWLFSGGDDKVTICWEDALYAQSFMPTRDAMNRAFLADCETENWPLMSELVFMFGKAVLVENSHLFYLAIHKHRPDFVLKFRNVLTYSLRFLKPLRKRNLLYFAIQCNDLVSLRAILLSWMEALNTNITDMLTQRLYHPSYFFIEDDLHSLANAYPQELVSFVSQLRLIRNHDSLLLDMDSSGKRVGGNAATTARKVKLDPVDRIAVTAVANPALGFSDAWLSTLYRLHRGYLEAAAEYLGFLESSAHGAAATMAAMNATESPESVTSLMIPLTGCASIRTIALFVEVSDALDSVELFDCPVGIFGLRYFWDRHGLETHNEGLLRYAVAFSIFILTLAAPFFKRYDTVTPTGWRVGVFVLEAVMIALFVYYLYDEFGQCRSKYLQIYGGNGDSRFSSKSAKSSKSPGGYRSRFFIFALWHIFGNAWNAIDFTVVISGIVGLAYRFIDNDMVDHPHGATALAICSVLSWVKVLYFMRPFASSGPLVACILRICYDIRYFVFLLFCVVMGFAQAFWVISNRNHLAEFGEPGKAMFNGFSALLGGTPDPSLTIAPNFATFLSVMMSMVLVIIMLNALIALMGDTFAEARALGLALWRREQATIVFEQAFARSDDKLEVAPYLHVLQYTSDVSHEVDEESNRLAQLVAASAAIVTPFEELDAEEEKYNQEREQKSQEIAAAIAAASEDVGATPESAGSHDAMGGSGGKNASDSAGSNIISMTEDQLNELVKRVLLAARLK